MREAIKENKKTILISSLIILLLIIGITFAYLITTINGEKEYIVKAKELELKLEEENELTLNNEIPIEDSEGLSKDGFKFSLKNNGKDDYEYTIYLDDIPLEEGENRIPDSAIRYSLDRNETVGVAKDLESMGVNPNRVVDSGEIGSSETINYTLRLWLDYDATNEEAGGKVFKGKLRVEVTMLEGDPVSDTIVDNVGNNGSTYNDGTDTFITGKDPNNYIWYSGKLWRAVSVNNEAKTTKLVTQWNISSLIYSSESANFAGSYMEEWLNDTTVDGFLGNLREPEKFIVMDAKWDASFDSNDLEQVQKPSGATIVEDAVGLLNIYEYKSSYRGASSSTGYLKNGLEWWTLTRYYTSHVHYVYSDGYSHGRTPDSGGMGVRPAINLKSNVKIVDGDGTIDNPYRLSGDNDNNLNGVKLNTRYSGEYIRFGNTENNLYRIVSHENGIGTKITSAEPLKSSGEFIESAFNSNDSVYYSSSSTIGKFLNGEYLNSYVDSEYRYMIEDETTWYRGKVGDAKSYKLTKYTNATGNTLTSSTTSAKVGLLRYGELMSGQFDIGDNNKQYWLLTPYGSYDVRHVDTFCVDISAYDPPRFMVNGVRPAMNLKENVVITSGDGTKNNPFTIELN